MTKVPRQDEFQRKGEAFESPKEFKPRKKKENRMAESYDTREMKTETEERQIQIRGTVSSLSNLCLAAGRVYRSITPVGEGQTQPSPSI